VVLIRIRRHIEVLGIIRDEQATVVGRDRNATEMCTFARIGECRPLGGNVKPMTRCGRNMATQGTATPVYAFI
jgi:hypothetical protein